ncbi:MAG: DUF3817 domain-containing protein [Flavobacteriaceae bacterium]|jgi:integral membrane protein|nr:DUF3817 domain-containing protein [Flavobacteriaceae bacterium]
MLKLFKFIALLEGLSLLLLFFVAMPMKYLADMPFLIRPVGTAHGVLFIAYIVFATVIKGDMKWTVKDYLLVCVASIVPFGTFYMEAKMLKNKTIE